MKYKPQINEKVLERWEDFNPLQEVLEETKPSRIRPRRTKEETHEQKKKRKHEWDH